MKKVLFVFSMPHNGGYVGGVASIINSYFNHVNLFEKQGFSIELFDYESKGLAKYPSKIKNVLYGIKQYKALYAKLKKEQVNVIHFHTSCSFLFLKDIILAYLLKKKEKAKVYLTIHVGAVETIFNRIGFAKRWCVNVLNQSFDHVFLLSNQLREELSQIGVTKDNTSVLYNFSDLEQVYAEKETNTIQLLYVGAIRREKGVLDLLLALSEMSKLDYHLNICGQLNDESIRTEFHNLVKKLSDKITLCGYVRGREKSVLYETADILILPSYHEGMPLVILEALSAGCAIVSTRVGTTTEILSSSNVKWVEIGNPSSLRNALYDLMTNPIELKKMQIENKAKSVNFTIENHIKTLCSHYSL